MTPNLCLCVMSGPAVGTRIPLDHSFLLGRDPSSRIDLRDERISRHHAMLELLDGQVILRDLGSRNGTFVNGVEIKDAIAIRPADRVRVGKTMLEVLDMEATPSLEGMPHPTETQSDSRLEPDSSDETLRVEKHLLRQATAITSRLASILRGRHPLGQFVSTLRKEFQGEAAGLLYASDGFEPILMEGILHLSEKHQALMRAMAEEGKYRSALLGLDGTQDSNGGSDLLLLPLRTQEETKYLFVVRGGDGANYGEEKLQLAETLVECLRMIPLDNLASDRRSHKLPDHLGIVGTSEVMNKVRDQLRSFAITQATVLIRGESGTGKELCARAVAQLSPRRFGPYVELNCACMTPDLMEAELFGHEKGSFTGAVDTRVGKLELAHQGTLFLDEIGELPLDLQAKLLRVLEGQPFYRVGGEKLIRSDVRFLCATNSEIEQMVDKGTFRKDLYHRINILRLEIPPLRDHLEDIPELVPYLMAQIQEDSSTPKEYTVTPKAFRRLLSHRWPGNVRELRNVLHRMILLSTGTIIDDHLVPPGIGDHDSETTLKLPRLQVLIETMEREEIAKTLLEAEGQKSKAARLLGISRPTLDKKIRLYGLVSYLEPKRKENGG